MALDQIDGVIDASRLPGDEGQDGVGLAEALAAGRVGMNDVRHRGRRALTGLGGFWARSKARSTTAFVHRFAAVLRGAFDLYALEIAAPRGHRRSL